MKKVNAEKANERTNENRMRILEHIVTHGDINATTAMELLKLGKTRTYEILLGMIEDGLIYAVGAGKFTRYIVRGETGR